MQDEQIIELYWARSENAISETADKYGKYCYYIAYNILHNNEDSEECVNDTYWKAWGVMPPQRPQRLSAFLGKITRNLALHRYEKDTAKKRGGGQMALALEELSECISGGNSVEQAMEERLLSEALNCFLAELSPEVRRIFMRRYWYLSEIKEIAADYRISESKVKVALYRTRKRLKQFLEKEGIML